MKTFKDFLLEDDEPQDLEDFLLDHCRPLMSELDADFADLQDLPLYRGIGHPSGRRVKLNVDGKVVYGYIQNVRKDRKPLDTHPEVSEVLDNYLGKEFGWKPRKTTVFAFGKHGFEYANNFGSVYRIYPMGKIRYMWGNRISDVTAALSTLLDKYHIKKKSNSESYDKDDLDEIADMIEHEFKGKYYVDNLWKAIAEARSEIMIDCAQYLAIKTGSKGGED